MNMYSRRPVLSSAVYDPTLDSINLDGYPLPSMTTSQSRTHSVRSRGLSNFAVISLFPRAA
jgi:hypothetical protein